MERRKFILAATSAGIAGIAGCTGDDDGGGNGDGGNGSGNGDDGGNGSGNGDDSGNGSGNGDDGGNGSGNGDGGGNGSGNGDDGGNGSGNGDDGGGNGDDGGNGGGDGPRLADVIQWEDTFVAEFQGMSGTEMDDTTFIIRFSGENIHQTVESPEGNMDIYRVDGDTYLVQGGQCLKNPGEVPTPDSDINPESREEVAEDHPDVTPAGRDTIDGEEMRLYEVQENGETVTLYVSVETGFLRRVEFDAGRIDYHSWGEVGPIEPPQMNCQEIGGGGADDYGG